MLVLILLDEHCTKINSFTWIPMADTVCTYRLKEALRRYTHSHALFLLLIAIFRV